MRLLRSSEMKARAAHALAGFNICAEGWERFDSGALAAGAALFALGVALLFFARFHPKLHRSAFSRHLDSAVFLLEAVVMAIISTVYFHHGKHGLPWCYAAVAVTYVVLAMKRWPAAEQTAAKHG